MSATLAGDLRFCSIADLDLEPESVDLILTDPPYPREFLPLWGDLGRLAAHALKPGGSLVAMSGHLFLPAVIEHLNASELQYRWTIACMTPGSNVRVWPVKMMTGWKPILWYAKGKAMPRKMMEDRVVSTPSKQFHGWGQDLHVFSSLARAFSQRGDLVVDPVLGGGTTAVACQLLGRRFIGCDVDETCLRKTEARLAGLTDYMATLRAGGTDDDSNG